MTPHEFISKWENSKLKERAAAQEHFIDLCRLLGEKTPAEVDAGGKDYAFEVGATKTTGGRGFADVFKRDHFGWEYKGTLSNLDTAFAQLQRYAVALDNPPLLIVSDIGTTIRIHTNWTNSVSQTYIIPIADLEDAEKRGWLKAAFVDPDALRPKKTRQELTEEVAGEFAELARLLRSRGHLAEEVAHFVNKLVFCMFAEDVMLLPDKMFTRMLDRAIEDPNEFEEFARSLFAAMKAGGRVGFEKVAWFNGGLFNDDRVFALTKDEIKIVRNAAGQYWGDIDPSILGTLFERGLDPDKRSQLGAHYTDRDKIMMIVRPVVMEPLSAEWETAKAEIAAFMEKAQKLETDAKTKGGRLASAALGQATVARKEAQGVLERHLKRLADFRILDPACGSGNFLYIALRELKDLEHRAQVEAEAMGLPRRFPSIGPEVVKGIEINPYAAELARVSVWIGEIQWMLKNGFPAAQNPVLKPMETIECRDALMNLDGTMAQWPTANVVIGNPPFVGNKKMIRELGESYAQNLRRTWSQVSGGVDLVAYWIAKAWELIKDGQLERAGFVTTNSIRGASNRVVLKEIVERGRIFNAWSDEPWVVDGASLRVSLIAFDGLQSQGAQLDGMAVAKIGANLQARRSGIDISQASPLVENADCSFVGVILNGGFEISGASARAMLCEPLNPNGRPNSDVLRPTLNGDDFNGNRPDKWIIDFGANRSLTDAMLYTTPFSYVEQEVKPFRQRVDEEGKFSVRAKSERERWWLHARARPALRQAIDGMQTYIATPMVTSFRNFGLLDASVLPDQKLVVFARSDMTFFGILESRFHLVWTRGTCAWIGAGNDITYSKEVVFSTFPFPQGMTPDVDPTEYASNSHANEIAAAAARLNELRESWLNPADLIRREPEVVPGFPDRLVPVNSKAAEVLQKRTLTNLYNDRPTWLDHAHKALDAAVAAAYGWPTDLSDDEVLARLFSLNQERAAAQSTPGLLALDAASEI